MTFAEAIATEFLGKLEISPANLKQAEIPAWPANFEGILTQPFDLVEASRLYSAFEQTLGEFNGLFASIGMVFQRVAESPPSAGYEPWLIERGWDPIAARVLAKLAIRRGQRIALEDKRLPAAVRAIKFLAKPGRRSSAVARHVDVLLAAWEESSVIETIFRNTGLDDIEFSRVLKSARGGDPDSLERLTEISARLAPHLPDKRGPKVSVASASHEAFLEFAVNPIKPSAYTWNTLEEMFTDAVTQATRREFADPEFDPRPAYRRSKALKKRV